MTIKVIPTKRANKILAAAKKASELSDNVSTDNGAGEFPNVVDDDEVEIVPAPNPDEGQPFPPSPGNEEWMHEFAAVDDLLMAYFSVNQEPTDVQIRHLASSLGMDMPKLEGHVVHLMQQIAATDEDGPGDDEDEDEDDEFATVDP